MVLSQSISQFWESNELSLYSGQSYRDLDPFWIFGIHFIVWISFGAPA